MSPSCWAGQSIYDCMPLARKRNALCCHCSALRCAVWRSFHAAAALREAVVREWGLLPAADKAALRAYLLAYVLAEPHLEAGMQVGGMDVLTPTALRVRACVHGRSCACSGCSLRLGRSATHTSMHGRPACRSKCTGHVRRAGQGREGCAQMQAGSQTGGRCCATC